MNSELLKLFDGLNRLCSENEAFYFSEQDYKNYIIRSYSYRLATHSDFELPYALDSRGTAFKFNKDTKEWSLFCRGYKKFFNLEEFASYEKYIEKYNIIDCFQKSDGSLILIGKIDGELVPKSKTSINSDHAKKAKELIDSNPKLQKFLNSLIDENKTPALELVGPEFKVVLNYPETELIFLGAVSNTDYKICTYKEKEFTKDNFGVNFAERYSYTWEELQEIQKTSKPCIEGFVVFTDNPNIGKDIIKMKVKSYVELHNLKDSINNEKSLVHIILEDDIDDLLQLFKDDKEVCNYILRIQTSVFGYFNHKVKEFKELRDKYFDEYNENRKDFALKFKDKDVFGIVMKSLRLKNIDSEELEKFAEKSVKEYISKKCTNQTKAKEFLEKIKEKNER